MNLFGWKTKSKTVKKKPAENVALDKADPKAFERISNLETDAKWPGNSSPPGSPNSQRRKLRRAMNKNQVPCDVVDASDGSSNVEIFARRSFNLTPTTSKKLLLGEGGFGKVILISGDRRERMSLVREETSNTGSPEVHYACKIIDARDKFEKRLREFGNELMGLNAGHSHPNIIQLYDAFIVNTNFYIVKEYADGVRL